MSQVDLLVPELAPHDATGTHTLLLRDVLVEMGRSVRFVTQIPAEVDEPFILADDWKDPAPVVILQHGIGSFVAEAAIERRVPVVVNYHNITPVEFVEPWTPELISGLRWGRSQLDQLAPRSVRGIAVSEYNATEMRTAGFVDVRVAPVLWNPHPTLEFHGLASASPQILFVGRVAANKCHEDLLAALALIVEHHPDVRLTLVGSPASNDYQHTLERYALRLGLGDAVEFAGAVSEEELTALYNNADVFVCMSEHEGFCVPIVEAMASGVPVIAHGAAAVPETVGDAGIVLHDKRPATVAAAVCRVFDDRVLADVMATAGRRRAADFSPEVGRKRMRAALEGLMLR